ncbi:hypothetical protein ACHAWU_008888 [Discostella pseudostelligera]|uniref:RNA polymerase Rpb4/RPC9 core domain-containing protein n=1 Tax=Discostella pseudostelligera TaxID=259834 RepID=A0ABD3N030_9STRA
MMSAADPYAAANGNTNGTSRSTSIPGAAASASNVTIENTAELSFPAEFDTDIQILSNAQVAVILQMSAQNALAYDMELNEIYKKTQKYVERYNTMKNPEKGRELVDELDNLQNALTSFRKETEDGRSELELHGFEVAALMNLVATDTMVEEAVALIPSLGRFPESAVDEILELIRSTMIRIVSYA